MASRTTGAEFPATPSQIQRRPAFSVSLRKTSYDDEIGLLADGPPHHFGDFKQNDKVFAFTTAIVFGLLSLFTHTLHLGIWNNRVFLTLFFFRYLRLIANTISWCLAKPWPRSSSSPLPHEASVIIPTVDVTSDSMELRRCIGSALDSGAAMVIVSTVRKHIDAVEAMKCTFSSEDQGRIQVAESRYPNKRWQHFAGLRFVRTPYVVFKDDTVFWPAGKNFLHSALAPFEDPAVGGVGTKKLVERKSGPINFLACLYLDRHNMETVSTNRIDGGVWVISGRTCLYRTEIMRSKKFLQAYLNETIWGFSWPDDSRWPKFSFDKGPLNADDDLFMSRWMATEGHKLFFQLGEDATMFTTIDVGPRKFSDKILRWFRGPWGRSNWKSVVEIRRILQHPWTYYAVHISGLVNFAFVWDLALMYAFGWNEGWWVLWLWIACSKLVKLLPHLRRNPSDIMYFPFYFIFAWTMSFVKLYAMLSWSDTSWKSRKDVEDGPRDYVVTDSDLEADPDIDGLIRE